MYDSGKFQLKEPKEVSAKERYTLAQEDFNDWFNRAQRFFEGVDYNLVKEYYAEAARKLIIPYRMEK